jgi:hypothetical protein
MSLLKSKTSTSSNLTVDFESPLTIDLTITPTWKRNVVSDESRALYGTEGAEYATIETVDRDGLIYPYRISMTTWQKCIDMKKNIVYPAIDDRDNVQLILPSTGSPTVLARLAALKAAKNGVQTTTPALTPKGDADAPF